MASAAARVTGTVVWLTGRKSAVVVGAVASTLTASVLVASTLPALSTERYARVWLPSPVMTTGSRYVVQAPLSSWNSVLSMPLPCASSAPASVTRISLVNHPFAGWAGSGVAVVTGAVESAVPPPVRRK